MVVWWKRLIYSLLSTVIGAAVCGAVASASSVIANSHGHIRTIGVLIAALGFDVWVVIFSVPGWLLAIPIVLFVRNISGWRFWIYFALGAVFGPALILGLAFYSAVRAPSFAGFPGNSMSVVYLAGAISAISSLVYLLLLRSAQKRSATFADVTTV
jgi:hypothetical protein